MDDMTYYNVEWNPRQSWMKIPRMRKTHKNKKRNKETKRKLNPTSKDSHQD